MGHVQQKFSVLRINSLLILYRYRYRYIYLIIYFSKVLLLEEYNVLVSYKTGLKLLKSEMKLNRFLIAISSAANYAARFQFNSNN